MDLSSALRHQARPQARHEPVPADPKAADSNGRLRPRSHHRSPYRVCSVFGLSPVTRQLQKTDYFCLLGADSAQALRPRGNSPLRPPPLRRRCCPPPQARRGDLPDPPPHSPSPLTPAGHPEQPGREQPPLTRRGRERRAARGRSRSSGPRRCFSRC